MKQIISNVCKFEPYKPESDLINKADEIIFIVFLIREEGDQNNTFH
jgi:hypothetical protein